VSSRGNARRELDTGNCFRSADIECPAAPETGAAVGDLAGLLRGERNQLGDVVGHLQRRMGEQPLVDADEAGDRGEVP